MQKSYKSYIHQSKKDSSDDDLWCTYQIWAQSNAPLTDATVFTHTHTHKHLTLTYMHHHKNSKNEFSRPQRVWMCKTSESHFSLLQRFPYMHVRKVKSSRPLRISIQAKIVAVLLSLLLHKKALSKKEIL